MHCYLSIALLLLAVSTSASTPAVSLDQQQLCRNAAGEVCNKETNLDFAEGLKPWATLVEEAQACVGMEMDKCLKGSGRDFDRGLVKEE